MVITCVEWLLPVECGYYLCRVVITCAMNWMILTKMLSGASLGTTNREPLGNRLTTMLCRRLAVVVLLSHFIRIMYTLDIYTGDNISVNGLKSLPKYTAGWRPQCGLLWGIGGSVWLQTVGSKVRSFGQWAAAKDTAPASLDQMTMLTAATATFSYCHH